MDIEKHINNISLFDKLEEVQKEKVLKLASIKKLHKDNILFYQGDESSYLHIVLKGKIEVYKVNASGKNMPLNLFKPYQTIAELSNYKNIPFPATAHALEESEVLLIDFKRFKEAFFSNPIIVSNILESMSDKILNLEKLISSHIVMNATQRVVYHLLEERINLNTEKHTVIADRLNISPVTLSRILKKLKEKNAVLFHKNFYTLNKDLLHNLCS
ncbi:MAG: transcriptional regulator [Sulfurovum sp.]|nr:MAG: transcriptional regulator [Sulfurovum sp.]